MEVPSFSDATVNVKPLIMNQKTHELEKNELVEWAKENLGFLGPHLRTIVIGLIGLVALVIGLSYYFQLRQQFAETQWREFHSALYNMMQMQNASGLQMIHDQAPDTPISHASMLFAGDNFLRLGLQKAISDQAGAAKELKKAKDSLLTIVQSTKAPDPLIETRALYLLGYACESLGEFDEAKKYYTQLNERFPKSAFAKQARRGLERLADPNVRKVFEQFKTVGVAPGANLPARPDLSFPDLDGDKGAAETPSGESGEAAPAQPSGQSGQNADPTGGATADQQSSKDG